MDRNFGIPWRTATDQLQRSYPHVGVQPLPAGGPGRVGGADLGIADNPDKPLIFYVIGDHGGVKTPGPQSAVASAMRQAAVIDKPSFVWSVGDIVYFNGDNDEYGPQFYEPYAGLAVPIVGIPGNHDGDTTDDSSRRPLDTFMANFCDKLPNYPAADPQFEYNRHTQTQPWCDWTLLLSQVTIIGMYSNVPSGGHFEDSQIQWLATELKTVPTAKPVIVSLHHPPYSVDAHHGGSTRMGTALGIAFQDRAPDMVLSGHVHDYQRFTETRGDKTIPYLVQGNSGYHNLHRLAPGALPGRDFGGVVFEYGDDRNYGYTTLTVDNGKISGRYTGVKPGTMPDGSDAQITAGLDSY